MPDFDEKSPQSEQNPEQLALDLQQEQEKIPEMTKLGDSLKSAKSIFFGDSESYRDVVMNLDSVNDILPKEVNPQNFQEVATEGVARYNQLLNACKAYIDSHKRPWTPTGKARKALTQQVYALAMKDINALLNGANTVAEKGSITLLGLVSEDARTVKIDLNGVDVKTIGNGSSTRLMFEHEGKDVFFTPEETLKSETESIQDAIDALEDNDFRRKFQRFEEDYHNTATSFSVWIMRKHIHSDKFDEFNQKQIAKYHSYVQYFNFNYSQIVSNAKDCGFTFTDDKECDDFLDACIAVTRAKNGAINFNQMGQISEGNVLSNRNVAMSRVADLLGIGHLLAHSVNAEIELNGEKIKGNLMEKAKGESLDSFEQSQVGMGLIDYSSGELQRQFVCLQVLDALCGQVDRNLSNFFYLSEESGGNKKMTGIHGIDNDMSFGKIDNLKQSNQQMPAMLNKAGGSTLPVVDKQLGERLLALTPEMLKFALADIIKEDAEITALISRLTQIQTALSELKSHDGENGQSTFVEAEDWGETTRKALMGGSGDGLANEEKKMAGNYYGRFVLFMRDISKDYNLGKHKAVGKNKAEQPSFGSYVMTSSTLAFMLNRSDIKSADKRKIEGMLFELIDNYHRCNNSGDKELARYSLVRIAEVCETRKNELTNPTCKLMLDKMANQCKARIVQLGDAPIANMDPTLTAGTITDLTNLNDNETVGLANTDPYADYPRLSPQIAKQMSDVNVYNQGDNRDIIYGDKAGTHGDKYGYIKSPNSMAINQGLRDGRLNPKSYETVQLLDKAAVSSKLPQKARFHRMCTAAYLVYGLHLPDSNENDVTSKNAADINKMAGTIITDSGFMCVGYLVDYMFATHKVMITLLADEGTPIFPTDNHDESEMILGRGTSYMILGARLHEASGGGQYFPLSGSATNPKAKANYKGLEIFAKIIKK